MLKEGKNKYNVYSVIRSKSFPEENCKDMDRIAQYLIDGGLIIPGISADSNLIKTKDINEFQKEVVEISPELISPALELRLVTDYLAQTMSEINKEDVRQGITALGASHGRKNDQKKFFSEIISGSFKLELKNWSKPENVEPNLKDIFDQISSNIIQKKYRCRVRLGISGNVYIFREVVQK
jgi:hypothetical protein